jgi:LmbE family N-acetylglucosaminyl deacetylase
MKCEQDPEYERRYTASITHPERRIVPRIPVVDPAAAATAAAAAAQQQRAERISRKERALANLAVPNAYQLLSYGTKLILMWKRERLPGLDCAKAYVFLKYSPLASEGRLPALAALARVAAGLHFLSPGHHPDAATYAEVPEAEKEALRVQLQGALLPFHDLTIEALLPTSDSHYPDIQERIREEAEARRVAAAAVAAAAAQAELEARRRQLQIDLRERPVVFRRDPEGSIDLRAFATDAQSVHRSSVQNATHKACLTLLRRPLESGQETLPELITDIENPAKIRISISSHRERIVLELTHDYFETEAFSLSYGSVLDRVWAYVRSHVHREALVVRLAQEIAEGVGQCSNGKMARLVNALQGFDDTLELDPPKELFQNHIVMLRGQPAAEREAKARALFVEYAIPDAEQGAWLEALADAE